MKQVKRSSKIGGSIDQSLHLDLAQYLYALAGLIFLVGVGLLLWFWQPFSGSGKTESEDTVGSAQNATDPSCEHRRVLDGTCVNAGEEQPPIVGVMIENHVDARPQAGLADATVVYEAPVEANITRFLALYPITADVAKIGPVRSARPYYLDWLAEYGDALYMHVGGSPDALAKIDAFDVFDINEMTRGWYFWRSDDRSAPHNTYTSRTLWNKAWSDYRSSSSTPASYNGWAFTTSTTRCTEACVDQFKVSFAPPSYEAEWRYASSTGRYERYQAGRSQRDENGRGIFADTVIVQHTNITVLDEIGRRGIQTAGSGSATVFHDGYEIEGSWEKRSRTGRTRWLDASGNEIPLHAGTIWIEVVGADTSVKTTPRV